MTNSITINGETFNIGDRVDATVTKNGYFHTSYKGVIVGFTKNNRIKVESWRGIKMHAVHNVDVYEAVIIETTKEVITETVETATEEINTTDFDTCLKESTDGYFVTEVETEKFDIEIHVDYASSEIVVRFYTKVKENLDEIKYLRQTYSCLFGMCGYPSVKEKYNEIISELTAQPTTTKTNQSTENTNEMNNTKKDSIDMELQKQYLDSENGKTQVIYKASDVNECEIENVETNESLKSEHGIVRAFWGRGHKPVLQIWKDGKYARVAISIDDLRFMVNELSINTPVK